MNLDPLLNRKLTQDDWYRKSPAPKKHRRKLTMLPTRKYVHYKGTMKRVRFPPAPSIQCVVMRWMDGEADAIPCAYVESEKLLILADNGIAYVFKSRMSAKRAIWHTFQREGIPGGHVDFVIVNK